MQVNGWELFAHPLLLDQMEKLVAAVEKEKVKKPAQYQGGANFKVLAALSDLLFSTIPSDPARPEYRQGSTLGEKRKHWFRVKFAGQRFRLFFRFDSKVRVILFAWVNDSDSLRTYGSKNDAYGVFKKMLDAGNPPDDWEDLLKTAKDPKAVERFEKSKPRQATPPPTAGRSKGTKAH